MSGNHRAEPARTARVAVAGALTAGALLLAPVGVAIATTGIAHAARPGGGSGDPGGPAGGVHKKVQVQLSPSKKKRVQTNLQQH